MNIWAQVFVWIYAFISCVYISRSRIARSYGNTMFNFLRICQIHVQSGCTILYSCQQCTRFPLSSPPCQHLLFSVFVIIAILVGVKYLIVVLTSISLLTTMLRIISYAYWLFAYLFWRNVYSSPFHILKLGCWSFYCWVVKVLHTFRVPALIRHMICKNLLPFYALSFHFPHSVLWPCSKFLKIIQAAMWQINCWGARMVAGRWVGNNCSD